MKNSLKQAPLALYSVRYDLYVFHECSSGRMAQWEHVAGTHCMKRAVKLAQLLKRKHGDKRIEIKKRSYCPQEKRFVGKTTGIVKGGRIARLDIVDFIRNYA